MIAKLPPEERTFVRFLIAPKATPLVMNDRMIDVIYKNIDLLEEPHIEALSKTMSPEDLVKLAEKFNSKLAALIAPADSVIDDKNRHSNFYKL
jgi:hypothetical protein